MQKGATTKCMNERGLGPVLALYICHKVLKFNRKKVFITVYYASNIDCIIFIVLILEKQLMIRLITIKLLGDSMNDSAKPYDRFSQLWGIFMYLQFFLL